MFLHQSNLQELQIAVHFALYRAKQSYKFVTYNIANGIIEDCYLENIGLQVNFPSESLLTNPGLTSISCPTFNTPLRILPPATPPFKSLTSQPGLLTSKDLITIKRGREVKSRCGTGIFFVMYSHKTYENNHKPAFFT